MHITPAIERANEVLLDLNGVFPGDDSHQKFKWLWSTDLWSLVPELDGNCEPKYSFRCPCGLDIKVHSATCTGITQATMRMSKCYMAEEFGPLASYRNMWVLCRWNPPPSPDEWKSAMGTFEDYPASGRYLPVSLDLRTVVIPPRAGEDDYLPISRLVVCKLVENIEKFKLAEEEKKIAKRQLPRLTAKGEMIEEPHKDAPFWKIRDRLKDKMHKYDPSATVGFGGKTQQGHKHNPKVHRAEESLAHPDSPLMREMRKPIEELAKELAKKN